MKALTNVELFSLHALASLRKPEITNDLKSLVKYFKSEFGKDVTEEELAIVLEPTIEEDIGDLRLIYKNVL